MDEYQKLDRRIQKWIFKQGWPDLREIQKKAIDPILSGDTDVLISASTAAGKTEAFFLPAMSAVADDDEGFGILYLSPLKALINDQYRRLDILCEMMAMPVTPWHGDASQSLKNRARKNPSGILLITPESLEAMLIKHAGWARHAFANTKYIVIDEFHAFIGTERGQQLLSLLNRLDHLLVRMEYPIPRVALSATLGDLGSVPRSLRPNGSMPCITITDSQGQATLKMQVKGYRDPVDLKANDPRVPAEYRICEELYTLCRGGSHLVFANSRQRTEAIAAQLSDFCETAVVPNEFFPHHGSLSKELREGLESRLQKETLPTTAICTMTLELGIDIGKVNSVIQVTAPHSVSSLRQRMGRSGRRGDPAILRMLISESDIKMESSPNDRLRMELVQSLAMIRLMITDKWFEPADTRQFHFSTLVHQIMATIAQWGGIRADQLYALLCRQGPFQQISPSQFMALLRHLGAEDCVTQLGSGELVLGIEGERLVNQYTFYAVFKTPEEFRVVNGAKTIGQLPVDAMILPNQHIIFAGRRWKVIDVDTDGKVIYVEQTKGGKPPRFGGEGLGIHDIIRKEMFSIYKSGDYRIATANGKVDFADSEARSLFKEGVEFFERTGLSNSSVIEQHGHVYVFPWLGDKVVNTLSAILVRAGFQASHYAGAIEVQKTSSDDVLACFKGVLQKELPSEYELADMVPEKHIEKFDELLPEDLLTEGYGRRMFDLLGAHAWLKNQFL
ncbi:DEAD/DEAH box helicase [Marinobacter xiaoshiensis]|uniref:DEAD/DEAH box helicase n=1 Tax=Marinobacter xiaoshiensis TaxID=3073652 RepID=A0ABU2HI51_9GAMM|nr:DEAD/DEAH box helicase [Marinobacter sp. F60267]MDS1310748.1 DEAD/DEAH box helicase [Marinobacter sp. F60267]